MKRDRHASENVSRRTFFHSATAATAGLCAAYRAPACEREVASFFLVGDTHYCAVSDDIGRLSETSASYNGRLVDWLNTLPGSPRPAEIGGGTVPAVAGVIHAGDIVDNADKGLPQLKMADTEVAAFVADYGLNGGEGRLRWPVREVHGNHDGPRGDTVVTREIVARNRRRTGLVDVSPSGLHYSWDWAGVHFVALGIVVGDAPEVTRKRRYAPLGSLPFLQHTLERHVGTSGRPVVLVHHVDPHRYSTVVPDEKVVHSEWDYGDARAFYETIEPYNVAATLCGHTHVRNLARWNGTSDPRVLDGVPFLNTDNAAHFGGPSQALLHVEIDDRETRVREFTTRDGWQTGAWTPQVWTFAHGA